MELINLKKSTSYTLTSGEVVTYTGTRVVKGDGGKKRTMAVVLMPDGAEKIMGQYELKKQIVSSGTTAAVKSDPKPEPKPEPKAPAKAEPKTDPKPKPEPAPPAPEKPNPEPQPKKKDGFWQEMSDGLKWWLNLGNYPKKQKSE